MLEIIDLEAKIKQDNIETGSPDPRNTNIINKLNLSVNPGEIHIIMGPNGSGKSSLASIIAGHPNYIVTNGQILFEGEDIINEEPDKRANKGIFLGFQYPVEIPGISNSYFLRTALNIKNKFQGVDKTSAKNFLELQEKNRKNLDLDKKLLSRHVNYGFSGGEKKRNEIFQMSMLKPKLSILDEIDSGLDIDALKNIGQNIQNLQTKDNATIIITHYHRILQYIKADYVHILMNGQIIKSGKQELVDEVETEGYANF